jgi:hypothetical protein
MGVNTKSFDNASDMITFSRASGGYGFTKVSYGSELVSNGTFDTDTTGWTPNNLGLLSIDAQRLKVETGNSGSWNYAYQEISVVLGQTYRFQASSVDGTATKHRILLGTTAANGSIVMEGGPLGAAGDKFVDIIFTATTTSVFVTLQNTDGVLGSYTFFDNISIKEVTYNSSDPSAALELIYHPNDVPRIEYNLDGSAKGILIEEARTNLVTYSEDLSTWYASVTVTDNSVTSPAQLQNASTLTSYSSGTSYGIDRGGITVTAGDHTLSAYFKANGFNYGKLTWYSAANSTQYAVFNLATGEVHGGIYDDAGIQDVGNGWYRCHITTSLNATSSGGGYAWISDGTLGRSSGVTGDGIKGIHAYGIQLEAGSFPTSYIKTAGSTVHRAFDLASIPVSEFGYNQAEGSFAVEFRYYSTSSSARIIELHNGNSSQRTLIGTVQYHPFMSGGANIDNQDVTIGQFNKLGVGLKTNDVASIANGSSTIYTDSSVVLSQSPSHLGIGSQYSGLVHGRSHINQP